MLGLVETKRQVLTKFDVARIWGYSSVGWEYVESTGASGGLLLMWDNELFKAVNCNKGEKWLCVEGVMMKTNFTCAFCLVYGVHEREEKRVVWEELSYVAGLCQVPFCFFGNFNDFLHIEERKGASSISVSAEEFKNWVQDMQLLDLPLNDRKFTWFRGRSCSRIDRVLVNIEWMEEFPDVRLKGGPRGLSDHCPLIVEDKRVGDGPRPFRSLDSWFTHDGFLSMVKNEWRNLGEAQFISKLKAMTGPLRIWHKNNFGGMDKRLKTLEEEIKKLDNMVSEGVYDGTMEARRKALVSFCEKWYVRKEVTIRGFYKNLYRQEFVPRIGFRDGLVRQIDGEVAIALEDIGQEFTAAVMDFFQSAKLPNDANVTWVTLALKFVGAKEIKDFRPISMVGCVYKVISKVLVRRMRTVMPDLVGETQSAFVKGRKIHDDALIACETVQWLKTRRKQAAIIKLDFQKAYDRVRWSFVDLVLQKMGFGQRWKN
ncbi:uncharacterized protein [Arachis hypogaea]|uniref:uncharacterized protein n=1 Tax=Arachis hypogaea TaxID=3818 RepID=UPI003B216EEE